MINDVSLLEPGPRFRALLLLLSLMPACSATKQGGSDEDVGCSMRISGVVTAPNGVDPMPGALVFISKQPPPPFPRGLRCELCSSVTKELGGVVVTTESRSDGTFTLGPIPEEYAGTIDLYIQKGRWRRKMQVRTTPCKETLLRRGDAHLPRRQSEGEMPAMAVAVGDYDAIECVLRHVGIDDSEFTAPTGTGIVHLYENEQLFKGGAPGIVPVTNLLLDARLLARYQIVLLNCTELGGIQPLVSDPLIQRNLLDYVTNGGRLYATDWAYDFVMQQPKWAPFLCFEFEGSFMCGGQGTPPFHGAARGIKAPYLGSVPTTMGGQQAQVVGLSQWLRLPELGLSGGKVPITDMLPNWAVMQKTATDMASYPTTTWLEGQTFGALRPLTVTFDYPQPMACGRVLYSSYHTRGHQTQGMAFPSYCPIGGIIPQERVLEYLLFAVSECVPILG